MYGRTSFGTMNVANAAAASWRPASMISNAPPAGRSGGDTLRQVAPPSVVSCTTPLFVAAQMTPALTADSEKVVIEGTCGERVGAGRPGTFVRSGLTSFQVIPASVVVIRNCVP